MGTKIRIDKDTGLSANPYSIIRTNAGGEQEYVAPGNIGDAIVVDTDGIPKYLPISSTFNLSITDGVNTQTVVSGDVITFVQEDGISLAVSATDVITIASRLSTDADNIVQIGTDGGLYANVSTLIVSATWNDTTNSLDFVLAGGGTLSVPIADLGGAWLFDLTIAGDSGTDLINNHETITFVGGTGITTTVTDNTVTIESTVASGTVTDVSIANSNGFNGTVATSTTTPVITLSTTITGILEGNGTAISAASVTGSGAVVLDTGASLTNPILGNATATTINKVTITQPATGATLTIADGFTLTVPANASVSGTNTGDDAVNSLYSGLVSNATHTGEVTGNGALTVDKTAISNKTAVTIVGTDYLLFGDTSDSDNLKKGLVSDIVSLASGGSPTILNPSQLTAWQNNYTAAATLVVGASVRIDADNSYPAITGLSVTAPANGDKLYFHNDGSYPFFFKGESADSTAANRIQGEDVWVMPNSGVTFEYNTSASRWMLIGERYSLWSSPYSNVYRNHMNQKVNNDFGWWTSGTAANNSVYAAPVADRPGIISMETGTTSTGKAYFVGTDLVNNNRNLTPYYGITIFECSLMFPILSNGTETFIFKTGLFDNVATSSSAGREVSFVYNYALNSGNWTLRTNQSATVVDNDSGIAVVANTWYDLKMIYYDNNRIDYWIDEVFIGSITTNLLPVTQTSLAMGIWKTAGTTTREARIDVTQFAAFNFR